MLTPSKRELLFIVAITSIVFIWSGIHPHDRLTWVLEVFPAVVAAVALFMTYRQFSFSRLAYWLIAIHAVILMVGGRYTYAEVPLFNWLRDSLGLARNHYDRIGHFAQGFVPAIVAREIMIRTSVLKNTRWLFFTVTCICLATSAFYELIEWWAALLDRQAAAAFLGAQGDVWDTQWDMFLALCGAISAQVFLGKLHDRQIASSDSDSTL